MGRQAQMIPTFASAIVQIIASVIRTWGYQVSYMFNFDIIGFLQGKSPVISSCLNVLMMTIRRPMELPQTIPAIENTRKSPYFCAFGRLRL